MRTALFLAALLLSSCTYAGTGLVQAGVTSSAAQPSTMDRYDDVGRIDFPDRGQTLFVYGCFTLYNPGSFLGFNCAGSTREPLAAPYVPQRYEGLVSTAFDTNTVFLVDFPCTLLDVTEFPNYTAYVMVCHDDLIFRNGFQQ